MESMTLEPTNKAELAKLRREVHNTDQLGKRIKMMTEAMGVGFAFAIAQVGLIDLTTYLTWERPIFHMLISSLFTCQNTHYFC